MDQTNPEIGRRVQAGPFAVNLHDRGQGRPVMLIHGSGPGVTAWANWRLVLPRLGSRFRVIAPDMSGFGYTRGPDGIVHDLDSWVGQVVAILDALGLDQVDLIGNSFGGAVALATAIRHPGRVGRLVLMGSVGVPFPLTAGLDAVWGYQPSVAAMRGLLDLFAYDRALVSDELAQLRYQASIRPGAQEAFSALFPAPRQRWVDALASAQADIRALPHQTLILHGRDDRVIPPETSATLHQWISASQLHMFGRCGHWVQIEQTDRFCTLVETFLAEDRG